MIWTSFICHVVFEMCCINQRLALDHSTEAVNLREKRWGRRRSRWRNGENNSSVPQLTFPTCLCGGVNGCYTLQFLESEQNSSLTVHHHESVPSTLQDAFRMLMSILEARNAANEDFPVMGLTPASCVESQVCFVHSGASDVNDLPLSL